MGIMNNRVIGVVIVECINSNFNSDLEGMPKHNGEHYVASPYAIKFSTRKAWDIQNRKPLIFRQYQHVKSKDAQEMNRTLYSLSDKIDERFGDLNNDSQKLEAEICKIVDVSNFGGTIALKKNNFSITGVVQFGTGVNIYKNTILNTVNSSAPMASVSKDSEDNRKSQGALTNRFILNEAHFSYDVTINPYNLNSLRNSNEFIEEYKREDYENFKETCIKGVSSNHSVAKQGCNVEFALWVELKDETSYIGAFNRIINIEKSKNKKIFNLESAMELLDDCNDIIDNIEIDISKPQARLKLGNISNELKSKIVVKNLLCLNRRYDLIEVLEV